jgi:hypothetical protein
MTGYSTGLLTYLDILGFQDLIDESTSDPAVVQKIAALLQMFEEQFAQGGRVGVGANNIPTNLSRFINFSDLMLRLTFVDASADLIQFLNWELLNLAHRQLLVLLEQHVLVRGAVTFDKVYCPDGKLIFGPSVVKGYRLERDLAVYPRIILDESLMRQARAARTDSHLWFEYFTSGDDGIEFVDYLCGVFLDIYSGRVQSQIPAHSVLERHREVIRQKLLHLDNKDMKRKAKIWWMWNYHNRTIDKILSLRDFDLETTDLLNACRIERH